MISSKKNNQFFAKCPQCEFVWGRRVDLLADNTTKIIAYQADFEELDRGYFVFKHSNCDTQFELQAINFKDLYNGPVYCERKTGTEICPGYCQNPDELKPCPEKCECSYVREIIQVISNWAKDNSMFDLY